MPRGFDLYPKNRSSRLDPDLFRNPTAEYRGTPLWSWNNKLDKDQLLRQIGQMQRMGLGGFHIHPRTGLATEYLGEEFMEMVVACRDEAKKRDMLCWLYDEDRWPSGFAGGLVTKDEQYRARYLLWTRRPYSGNVTEANNISNSYANRNENGRLLATYDVTLEDGLLKRYDQVDNASTPQSPNAVRFYAYLEVATPIPWYNNQTYVDTLNPAAMRRFIEVTHERYRDAIGEDFGGLVPAIFTDEPQFIHKQAFSWPDEDRDRGIPFTDDFFDTYQAAYGDDLREHLPEVFWELPERAPSLTRYRYHDHLAERFASAFADQIGNWCEQHGIALTGHMMEEPTLTSQTAALSEAMRSYRSFHIPGIDMLCDAHEYTTAKQAQSAARQYGRPGVMSELYGVTNWDFDFVGHKAQGDWQAALGVSVRVPHLTWVSMAGEAKRDYPASIGYQSPWYLEYGLIEDHFGRVNAAITRGKPVVRVGVIHPIESFWLCFGPLAQTRIERDEREKAFSDLTNWLLFGLIDFDFIAESLLPSQGGHVEEGRLAVGEARYDVVIVPGMRTIRSTTLDRLEAFAAGGGTVVWAGEVPSLVDAMPSDRATRVAGASEGMVRVPFGRSRLLDVLEPWREIDARQLDGSIADSVLYQMRQDGDDRYVFLVNTDRLRPRPLKLRFAGRYAPVLLDTMTGEQGALPYRHEGDWTVMDWGLSAHGSLLLRLEPTTGEALPASPELLYELSRELPDLVTVTLSEPNCLLLDQTFYRIDGGDWQGPEEILRIENIVRQQVGLSRNTGSIAQPWADAEPTPILAMVELRIPFETTVDLVGCTLAIEDPEETEVLADGEPIGEPDGWWVDESIRTLSLPVLEAGRHEIQLTIPFHRKRAIEWVYVLGDFGVEVRGRHARIVEPVTELTWGDWCGQGLPFYAGNVTYHCTVRGDGRPTRLKFHRFKNPLLTVDLDGQRVGPIAFAPYELDLGSLEGKHKLDITAYGNRVNAFGTVHNVSPFLRWYGPDAWRSQGDHFSYEYNLRPMGILTAPRVFLAAEQ
jgi:hypothetical protein